ncbi:hypothetical protein EV368DRAFT_64055 [Lentinula lateritia]|nr:hypothetical protein EV368DRAFT_64055 [Lentinula lateritia]
MLLLLPFVLCLSSESITSENSKAFFPFLDCVTDLDVVIITPNKAPKAIYSSSLDVTKNMGLFSKSGALAVVEMSLAFHAAMPKIEAFYHHYMETVKQSACHKECGSWVDWYGSVVCDVELLAQLAGPGTIDLMKNYSINSVVEVTTISSNYMRPKILPFDHIYPPPDSQLETPPCTAILYASLASPNFCELYMYLMRLTSHAEHHIEYILRHE